MAYCIDIIKIKDDDFSAFYFFYPCGFKGKEDEYGVFEFIKETESSQLIKSVINEKDNQYFLRASFKIAKMWKEEKQLPEKAMWAS